MGNEVFFISDIHGGHGNIIKYTGRPFMNAFEQKELTQGNKNLRISPGTILAHDEALLANINQAVSPDKTLFVLGDFCWGHKKWEAQEYLDRINCKNIILIRGNHDSDEVCQAFTEVHDLLEIQVDGQPVVLCHYPMLSWNRSFHGSWQLYGHLHSLKGEDRCPDLLNLDVGVDAHDYVPWSWAEIQARMQTKMVSRS